MDYSDVQIISDPLSFFYASINFYFEWAIHKLNKIAPHLT